MVTSPHVDIPKRAYSIREFRAMGGPCRAAVYQLANAGRLTLHKIDGRTVILTPEVERFFAELPAYEARE